MNELNELGPRIKKLRDENRMTQQALGLVAGLHSTNIGRIEKGKITPTADVLLKIAHHFGVSCDWLLTGENDREPAVPNQDELKLIRLYRRLSTQDRAEVMGMVEYKIYKSGIMVDTNP